jgi:hypothetical protein
MTDSVRNNQKVAQPRLLHWKQPLENDAKKGGKPRK